MRLAIFPVLAVILAWGGWIGITRAQDQRVRLEGRVVDADSGRLLPCRLYVEGPAGTWHVVRPASPEGAAVPYRKERVGSVEVHTALSADPFIAELAPGEYRITAVRGKEYLADTKTVKLAGGRPAQVTLKLRRWINMAARGWFSGETHVHRGLDELPILLPAEDLNVAFPLSYWVTKAFEPPARSDKSVAGRVPEEVIRVDKTHLIWPRNTEYEITSVNGKRYILGAFFIIGHRGLFEQGVPPVGPIGRQARRSGGLLELDKHAWPWSMALVPVLGVDLYELANNHMWRAKFGFSGWGQPAAPYMTVERGEKGWTEWGWIQYTWQNYYALLDCGFRLQPTAGTASGVHPVPLGFSRVYVKLDGELTVEKWLRGLKEGRSFVTNGPMLFVEVNGEGPGHTFRVKGPADYTVAVRAVSSRPLDSIELVRNGVMEKSLPPANRQTARGAYESLVSARLRVKESTWVAVRALERLPEGRVRFAHSSPVFIDVEGKPLRPRRAEINYLIRRVQQEIDRGEGVLPEAAMAEYRQALAAYRKIAAAARP